MHLGEGDRLVDLVQEGVDCVLRVGNLADSAMVARRVAMLEEVTCASPDYLRQFGVPETPDQLTGHRMIGFVSSATKSYIPLEFTVNGKPRHVTLPATVSVTGAETNIVAARLGLGLIQVLRYHVEQDLKAGGLIAVLPLSSIADAGVSAVSAEPAALTARPRVRGMDNSGVCRTHEGFGGAVSSSNSYSSKTPAHAQRGFDHPSARRSGTNRTGVMFFVCSLPSASFSMSRNC